jgi:hypothetical protein
MGFYEIYGVEEDGRIFGCVVMDCLHDEQATRIAGEYAADWKSKVRLYETPELNLGSTSSFDLWPDKMRLVAEVR